MPDGTRETVGWPTKLALNVDAPTQSVAASIDSSWYSIGHGRTPMSAARPITGALAVQYEPAQRAINLAGLRSISRALGGAITEPLPPPRGAHPIPGAIYVGERAWCCGLFDPEWSTDWDRAPEELSSMAVPCSTFIRVARAPEKASCE